MQNDETPTPITADERIEPPSLTDDYAVMLESLESQSIVLFEAVMTDPTLESDARRTAKRHCREVRAELECIRRSLPETATDDGRNVSPGPPNENRESAGVRPKSDDRLAGVTTVSDPMEALHEAANRRRNGQG
ncbi:hypothetical protein [Natronorubrum daqingense]|uniref:Uncharacterized protein n=1 Tax=Natronorubrum daqingense TaxID=588898 RepID=A0A1N7BSM2_9EURY|nr:hypothetical protein [Natronorubrum daqingense]APX96583.1 hypothetical protein BB347_08105 [Natronorubrum daqingense]SIR54302.1 hypothetical protein SAMN05421809_1337 [Natronorubrum daqingense]